MTYKEKPTTVVSSCIFYFLASLLLTSCTVRSTGGYVTGKGNSSLFEPVHAAAAETLTPTLNNNYCFTREEWQMRRYDTREQLIEMNGRTVDQSKEHEYEFSNRCD